MKRRSFITLLGGAAITRALPAAAQQSKRLPVVAIVFAGPPMAEVAGPDPVHPVARGLVHGLRDLGWIDGSNIVIQRHTALGVPQRAPGILAELIAQKVDAIVLGSSRWLQDAAQQATRTIPTVTFFQDDPVAAGLVTSLARPGGNLTGVTASAGPELYAKRLQLLQELSPRIGRVAFLGPKGVLEQERSVARPSGITIVPAEVEVVTQFRVAFDAIQRMAADALMVAGGPVTYTSMRNIVNFASESRLPAIYPVREAVEAGGLISYGTSLLGTYRQVAALTDRILKGARPADLPVQQPTTFEMVINRKTAKALGLTIPPAILIRADEVIE